MQFFKEYWLWILIPFLLVIAAVGVLFFLGGSGEESDFVYNVF